MNTTIKTLDNFSRHLNQQCTSLQEYKASKESKTMAECQAKFYSEQIVNKMHPSPSNSK